MSHKRKIDPGSVPTAGPLGDSSLVGLVIANLVVIVIALVLKWDLGPLMWIYWGQSVIIGFFNFLKMITLRQFSTEDFYHGDGSTQVSATRGGQLSASFFFAFHYGFFHFGYYAFLRGMTRRGFFDDRLVLFCVALFLVNHYLSYRKNQRFDQERMLNLGKIMFRPYVRIIPMHLTIIGSGLLAATRGGAFAESSIVLLLFLLLKTGADAIMHHHWHRVEGPPSENMWRP